MKSDFYPGVTFPDDINLHVYPCGGAAEAFSLVADEDRDAVCVKEVGDTPFDISNPVWTKNYGVFAWGRGDAGEPNAQMTHKITETVAWTKWRDWKPGTPFPTDVRKVVGPTPVTGWEAEYQARLNATATRTNLRIPQH